MQYERKNLTLAILADVKIQLDATGHAVNDDNPQQAIDRLDGMLNSLKTVAGILQLPALQGQNVNG